MQVTQDEYELPIAMATTARELAEMVGKTEKYIQRTVSEYERGIKKKSKYRRVEIEDDSSTMD